MKPTGNTAKIETPKGEIIEREIFVVRIGKPDFRTGFGTQGIRLIVKYNGSWYTVHGKHTPGPRYLGQKLKLKGAK